LISLEQIGFDDYVLGISDLSMLCVIAEVNYELRRTYAMSMSSADYGCHYIADSNSDSWGSWEDYYSIERVLLMVN
jgi:hypothetical protein